jgi:hypothetical protein
MMHSAARTDRPIDTLTLADAHAQSILDRDMILVRPDHHVAWRANGAVDDAGAILDKVRGIGQVGENKNT